MVDERIKVINAPAGSGKTTQIQNEIIDKLKNGISKKILCLTYTNRAVEELKRRVESQYVDIYTIHSFLQKETKLIFHNKDIIDLYMEVFEAKINADIANESKSSRYKMNYENVEEITLQVIRANINKVDYNERNFSSYLYGTISHDDLLLFVKVINEKFEYFKMKINGMYEVIYLDEYQDTSIQIISFLNNVVHWDNSTLILKMYGDNMQKIYSSDNKLKDVQFNHQKLTQNYRSSNRLIKLFNKIYNQPEYHIPVRIDNEYKDYSPKLELIEGEFETINKIKEEGFMNLSSNYRQIFNILLGSSRLLDAYGKLERDNFKIYGFTADLSASDLLINIENWNKDMLLDYMNILFELIINFNTNNLGQFMSAYRNSKLLNQDLIKIKNHDDRIKISVLLNEKFNTINLESNFFDFLQLYNEFFKNDVTEELAATDINYFQVLNEICIKDYWELYNYIVSTNKQFGVSTQHGVKGESHDNINLICENNKQSNINYELFFKYFTKHNIDILKLEEEYEKLQQLKLEFFSKLGISKLTDLKNPIFIANKQQIEELCTQIEELQLEQANIFINKIDTSGVTKFKNLFREINECEKYLLTFKIFYVGCSRAREKLVVKVNKSYINNFESEFLKKMKLLGFEVENTLK